MPLVFCRSLREMSNNLKSKRYSSGKDHHYKPYNAGKRTSFPVQEKPPHDFAQSPVNQAGYSPGKYFSSSPYNADRRNSFPLVGKSSSYFRKSLADQTPYATKNLSFSRLRYFKQLPRYEHSNLTSNKFPVGFIDTHCHLDFLFERQNYERTYADFKKENTFPDSYEGCVAVFCNPYTFAKKSLWETFLNEESVWAAFGCHPHNAKDYNETIEFYLEKALNHPRVVALGEIGLDYSNRNNCEKECQHRVFRAQLTLAKTKKLPLVIHCRDAYEDCLEILKEMLPADYYIHLHCFTHTWEWAEKMLDSFPNLFIGITNVVTFPSAESVHEVVKNIPLNRLLLETDAPYFVPRPLGKQLKWSHPGLAIHVAAQIAAIKEISLENVLTTVRNNTHIVYGI